MSASPSPDLRVTVRDECADDPDPPALSAAVEAALYRIAVAALDNAVRHGRAECCSVLLTRTDHRVEMTVTDDGSGLPAFTVNGDTTQNLDFPATAPVQGQVNSSTDALIRSGAVYFYHSCTAYNNADPAAYATIAASGRYTVDVPAGNYRVFVEPARTAAASWHNAKATCGSADVVDVSDGTQDLIAAAGARLHGTVTSLNGPVSLFATCQDYATHTNAAFKDISKGTYTLRVLPGIYRILIDPNPGTKALESWHPGKATCEEAEPINVSSDATLNLVAVAKDYVPPAPPPVTPPVTPPPPVIPPQEPPALQSLGKLAVSLKHGKKMKLAAATSAGVKITWRSLTPKTCVVKKSKVVAKKKGKCKLSATAPAVSGYAAFNKRYVVKIR